MFRPYLSGLIIENGLHMKHRGFFFLHPHIFPISCITIWLLECLTNSLLFFLSFSSNYHCLLQLLRRTPQLHLLFFILLLCLPFISQLLLLSFLSFSSPSTKNSEGTEGRRRRIRDKSKGELRESRDKGSIWPNKNTFHYSFPYKSHLEPTKIWSNKVHG